MELERIALTDEYFIEKKLYPNIDFYSGITLKALGFPTTMFTVLFAVARTVGWIAQWKEMIEDPSQRIGRPRQLYTGADRARLRADLQAALARSAAPRGPLPEGRGLLHAYFRRRGDGRTGAQRRAESPMPAEGGRSDSRESAPSRIRDAFCVG